MDEYLHILFGLDDDVAFPLGAQRREVLIGRSSDADVQIPEASVALAHARLVLEKARIVVTDLGSSAGTFVGGERLRPNREHILPMDATRLRIGHVELRLYRGPSMARPAGAAPMVTAEVDIDIFPVAARRGTAGMITSFNVEAASLKGTASRPHGRNSMSDPSFNSALAAAEAKLDADLLAEMSPEVRADVERLMLGEPIASFPVDLAALEAKLDRMLVTSSD